MWEGWVGTIVTLAGAGILVAGIVYTLAGRGTAADAAAAARRKKTQSAMVAVGTVVVALGIALM